MVFSTLHFNGEVAVRGLARISDDSRVAHARELLGKRYERSIVKSAEHDAVLQRFIYGRVHSALKGTFAFQTWKVAETIIEEGRRHEMDPLFILAVIEHESRFNPTARGSHGEIGLMQVKPDTAEWIAHKNKLGWSGPATLLNMVENIRIGTAYMAFLRKSFHMQSGRYVNAYNMGARSLRRALAHQIMPHTYSTKVMSKYLALYTDAVQARPTL